MKSEDSYNKIILINEKYEVCSRLKQFVVGGQSNPKMKVKQRGNYSI